ncbi:hypothetical protein ILUMI_16113 [Ignelater luminosus]|uniref:Uncharacterized protein n=1 Tax=Ignelater luminosus TaxID=2038154 RepID=A0A8K0CMF5_IGNLU|nr:hypothetical protein ILUMI_16113 [Ignelater luminosus]
MDQLTKCVTTFPTPSKIIADNQFDTVVFEEFYSLYKIVYHFTTPKSSTEGHSEIMQIFYQQIKEREQLRKQTANEKAKEGLNEDKTKDIHNKKGFENLKLRVKMLHKFKPMKIVADSGQVVITDKDKKVHKSSLKVRKYKEDHNEESSN